MAYRTARTLQVYEKASRLYLDQWGQRRYRVPPLLRQLLKVVPKETRILDLGCGPGQDLRYLKSRGYRALGLDGAWPFLTWARNRTLSLPLVQGNLSRLPFGPESFNAIWAAASLIHLTKRETRQTLSVLSDTVKPGGLMAATLLHGKVSGVLSGGWLPGRYFSRWTKDELNRAVVRAGWTVDLLVTVTNRERKGRWLNLMAHRNR